MNDKGFQRQPALPLRRAARIAWRNLRIRFTRSILVLASIALAVSFLVYTLVTEGLLQQVATMGSVDLVESLQRQGVLQAADSADQRIQTRWMMGLALLIAFVGITNSMVMSVAERTREIGTMKCLGARDSFIVKVYLIESLAQGVIGTLAGIVTGTGLAYIEGLGRYGAETWGLIPPAMLLQLMVLCAAVGLLLTIGGALYPALRAARMQPIEALRTDI